MSNSESVNTEPPGEPGSLGQAVASISVDQFAKLLAAINNTQRSVDSKLAQFQEEVRQGQEEAAVKALKEPSTSSRMPTRNGATKNKPRSTQRWTKCWRKPRVSYLLFRPLPYLPQQFGGSRKRSRKVGCSWSGKN